LLKKPEKTISIKKVI